MATAAKTRPDLMALGQAQSAQAAAVGAAKSDFGPRVSAYGNWEEDRASFAGSGGNNWVAGVQISVDILPIGKRAQLGAGERRETEDRRATGRLATACAARSEPGAHSPTDSGTLTWRRRGPRWINRRRVFAF